MQTAAPEAVDVLGAQVGDTRAGKLNQESVGINKMPLVFAILGRDRFVEWSGIVSIFKTQGGLSCFMNECVSVVVEKFHKS